MITPPRIASPPLCKIFAAQAQKIWDDLWTARISGINRSEKPSLIIFFSTRACTSARGDDVPIQQIRGELYGGGLGMVAYRRPAMARVAHPSRAARGRRVANIRRSGTGCCQRGCGRSTGCSSRPCGRRSIRSTAFTTTAQRGQKDWPGSAASLPRNLELFGCTIAQATAVQRQLAQGGAGLPKMSKVSYPLACLVCCPGATEPDRVLPARAYDVTARLRMMADIGADAPSKGEGIGALRDHPPPYVERLLDYPLDERPRVIEEIRHEAGDIGSLVVIREQPAG